MKVVVFGSRGYTDYTEAKEILDHLPVEITEVVCGEADGADQLGKRYAEENGIYVISMPAKWYPGGKYDPDAGKKRNIIMGEIAEYGVGFNLGTPGTRHMISVMKGSHKRCLVYEECSGCGMMQSTDELIQKFGRGVSKRYCRKCIEDQTV